MAASCIVELYYPEFDSAHHVLQDDISDDNDEGIYDLDLNYWREVILCCWEENIK